MMEPLKYCIPDSRMPQSELENVCDELSCKEDTRYYYNPCSSVLISLA